MAKRESKLKQAAARAVMAWCTKRGIEVRQIAHIYPRAYVLGYSAPSSLVLAVPWQDSEPHTREFTKANPIQVVSEFDLELEVGMWCAAAYIVSPGIGQMIAVRFEG